MEIINKIFQIDDGSIFSKTTDSGGVFWNPLLLIIIVAIVLLLVFLFGKIFFRDDYNKNTNQVKPYNSGSQEEINYNIKAENLYWGFRKAYNSYYEKVGAMHTGDLTDYIKWLIITIAVCLLFVLGGLL